MAKFQLGTQFVDVFAKTSIYIKTATISLQLLNSLEEPFDYSIFEPQFLAIVIPFLVQPPSALCLPQHLTFQTRTHLPGDEVMFGSRVQVSGSGECKLRLVDDEVLFLRDMLEQISVLLDVLPAGPVVGVHHAADVFLLDDQLDQFAHVSSMFFLDPPLCHFLEETQLLNEGLVSVFGFGFEFGLEDGFVREFVRSVFGFLGGGYFGLLRFSVGSGFDGGLNYFSGLLVLSLTILPAHLNNLVNNQLGLYQMRLVKFSLFPFCRQQAAVHDHYFLDVPRLKRTLQKQHFFVRKHHKEFGLQIQRCIMAREWQVLRNGLKCINVGQLDSWLTLRQIGLKLTEVLNTISLKKTKGAQLQDLLQCLSMLKYEPIPTPATPNPEYPFDDIQSFHSQLITYVSQVPYHKRKAHYIQLMFRLLDTNPQLFQPHRDKVQQHLIQNLQSYLPQDKFFLTYLISSGVISGYWTHSFKQDLASKAKDLGQLGLIQSLYFQDLAYPNHVTPSDMKNKVRTEEQIVNILEGYGYPLRPNVDINRYEVDVLISDLLVVEYNGHHHYVINSEKLVPTRKHQWKNEVLRRRGYVVSSIAYPEWKRIGLFEEKRRFLVGKIESDLLRRYFG